MAERNFIFGSVVCVLFGLGFAAVGGFLTYLFAADLVRHVDTWVRWKQTSCTVLSSEVSRIERESDPYVCRIEYELRAEGAIHRSTQHRIALFGNADRYSRYDNANELALRFPQGATVECYYNPSNPSQSVLKRNVPWHSLFVLLPLVFLIIGLVLAAAPFLSSKDTPAVEKALSMRESKDSRRGRRILLVFLALFLSLFFFIGVSMLDQLVLAPRRMNRAAQSWEERRCTIVTSSIQIYRGDESDSYSPDILFEYEVFGKTYRSSQLNFLSKFGTSTHAEAKSIVKLFPPGTVTPCYVNPANPNQAVIQLRNDASISNLVGSLVFLSVGLIGVVVTLFHAFRTPNEPSAGTPVRSSTGMPIASRDKIILESTHGKRLFGIFVGLLVAGFWNGIVGVIAYGTFSGGLSAWHIFPAVFLSIFALIGLLLFVFLIVLPILAIFSPRIRVEIAPGSARPGERLEYHWSILGSTEGAESMRIQIEAYEEATYVRGTDTTTDRSLFQVIPLATIEGAALRLRTGSGSAQLPARLLPSFSSNNNRIVYKARALLQIKRRLDVLEEAEFTVNIRERR